MKYAFLVSLLCILIVCCGCQPPVYSTLTNSEKAYPKTSATSVKVTTQDQLEGQTTEVGYIFAPGKSMDDSIERLKERASEMGGTGVVQLRTMVLRSYIVIIFIPIPTDYYYAQGIVVKS